MSKKFENLNSQELNTPNPETSVEVEKRPEVVALSEEEQKEKTEAERKEMVVLE